VPHMFSQPKQRARSGSGYYQVAPAKILRTGLHTLAAGLHIMAAGDLPSGCNKGLLQLPAGLGFANEHEVHGMPNPFPQIAVLLIGPPVLWISTYANLEHKYPTKSLHPTREAGKDLRCCTLKRPCWIQEVRNYFTVTGNNQGNTRKGIQQGLYRPELPPGWHLGPADLHSHSTASRTPAAGPAGTKRGRSTFSRPAGRSGTRRSLLLCPAGARRGSNYNWPHAWCRCLLPSKPAGRSGTRRSLLLCWSRQQFSKPHVGFIFRVQNARKTTITDRQGSLP